MKIRHEDFLAMAQSIPDDGPRGDLARRHGEIDADSLRGTVLREGEEDIYNVPGWSCAVLISGLLRDMARCLRTLSGNLFRGYL